MDSWLVFQHRDSSVRCRGGTQKGRSRGPIGHGPFLIRRRLAVGKSAARLSGGIGKSGDFGQSDEVEPMLARKASLLVTNAPVPQTDTGRWW